MSVDWVAGWRGIRNLLDVDNDALRELTKVAQFNGTPAGQTGLEKLQKRLAQRIAA